MLLCEFYAFRGRVDSFDALKPESAKTFTQKTGSTANVKSVKSAQSLVVSLYRLLELPKQMPSEKVDPESIKLV